MLNWQKSAEKQRQMRTIQDMDSNGLETNEPQNQRKTHHSKNKHSQQEASRDQQQQIQTSSEIEKGEEQQTAQTIQIQTDQSAQNQQGISQVKLRKFETSSGKGVRRKSYAVSNHQNDSSEYIENQPKTAVNLVQKKQIQKGIKSPERLNDPMIDDKNTPDKKVQQNCAIMTSGNKPSSESEKKRLEKRQIKNMQKLQKSGSGKSKKRGGKLTANKQQNQFLVLSGTQTKMMERSVGAAQMANHINKQIAKNDPNETQSSAKNIENVQKLRNFGGKSPELLNQFSKIQEASQTYQNASKLIADINRQNSGMAEEKNAVVDQSISDYGLNQSRQFHLKNGAKNFQIASQISSQSERGGFEGQNNQISVFDQLEEVQFMSYELGTKLKALVNTILENFTENEQFMSQAQQADTNPFSFNIEVIEHVKDVAQEANSDFQQIQDNLRSFFDRCQEEVSRWKKKCGKLQTKLQQYAQNAAISRRQRIASQNPNHQKQTHHHNNQAIPPRPMGISKSLGRHAKAATPGVITLQPSTAGNSGNGLRIGAMQQSSSLNHSGVLPREEQILLQQSLMDIVSVYDKNRTQIYSNLDEMESRVSQFKNTREKLNVQHLGTMTTVEQEMEQLCLRSARSQLSGGAGGPLRSSRSQTGRTAEPIRNAKSMVPNLRHQIGVADSLEGTAQKPQIESGIGQRILGANNSNQKNKQSNKQGGGNGGHSVVPPLPIHMINNNDHGKQLISNANQQKQSNNQPNMKGVLNSARSAASKPPPPESYRSLKSHRSQNRRQAALNQKNEQSDMKQKRQIQTSQNSQRSSRRGRGGGEAGILGATKDQQPSMNSQSNVNISGALVEGNLINPVMLQGVQLPTSKFESFLESGDEGTLIFDTERLKAYPEDYAYLQSLEDNQDQKILVKQWLFMKYEKEIKLAALAEREERQQQRALKKAQRQRALQQRQDEGGNQRKSRGGNQRSRQQSISHQGGGQTSSRQLSSRSRASKGAPRLVVDDSADVKLQQLLEISAIHLDSSLSQMGTNEVKKAREREKEYLQEVQLSQVLAVSQSFQGPKTATQKDLVFLADKDWKQIEQLKLENRKVLEWSGSSNEDAKAYADEDGKSKQPKQTIDSVQETIESDQNNLIAPPPSSVPAPPKQQGKPQRTERQKSIDADNKHNLLIEDEHIQMDQYSEPVSPTQIHMAIPERSESAEQSKQGNGTLTNQKNAPQDILSSQYSQFAPDSQKRVFSTIQASGEKQKLADQQSYINDSEFYLSSGAKHNYQEMQNQLSPEYHNHIDQRNKIGAKIQSNSVQSAIPQLNQILSSTEAQNENPDQQICVHQLLIAQCAECFNQNLQKFQEMRLKNQQNQLVEAKQSQRSSHSKQQSSHARHGNTNVTFGGAIGGSNIDASQTSLTNSSAQINSARHHSNQQNQNQMSKKRQAQQQQLQVQSFVQMSKEQNGGFGDQRKGSVDLASNRKSGKKVQDFGIITGEESGVTDDETANFVHSSLQTGGTLTSLEPRNSFSAQKKQKDFGEQQSTPSRKQSISQENSQIKSNQQARRVQNLQNPAQMHNQNNANFFGRNMGINDQNLVQELKAMNFQNVINKQAPNTTSSNTNSSNLKQSNQQQMLYKVSQSEQKQNELLSANKNGVVDSSYVDESVQSSSIGQFYGDEPRQGSSIKKSKKLKEAVIIQDMFEQDSVSNATPNHPHLRRSTSEVYLKDLTMQDEEDCIPVPIQYFAPRATQSIMTNSDVGRLRIDNSMLNNLTRHLDANETTAKRIGFDTNGSMQINATLYNQLKHLFMQATRGEGGASGALPQRAQQSSLLQFSQSMAGKDKSGVQKGVEQPSILRGQTPGTLNISQILAATNHNQPKFYKQTIKILQQLQSFQGQNLSSAVGLLFTNSLQTGMNLQREEQTQVRNNGSPGTQSRSLSYPFGVQESPGLDLKQRQDFKLSLLEGLNNFTIETQQTPGSQKTKNQFYAPVPPPSQPLLLQQQYLQPENLRKATGESIQNNESLLLQGLQGVNNLKKRPETNLGLVGASRSQKQDSFNLDAEAPSKVVHKTKTIGGQKANPQNSMMMAYQQSSEFSQQSKAKNSSANTNSGIDKQNRSVVSSSQWAQNTTTTSTGNANNANKVESQSNNSNLQKRIKVKAGQAHLKFRLRQKSSEKVSASSAMNNISEFVQAGLMPNPTSVQDTSKAKIKSTRVASEQKISIQNSNRGNGAHSAFETAYANLNIPPKGVKHDNINSVQSGNKQSGTDKLQMMLENQVTNSQFKTQNEADNNNYSSINRQSFSSQRSAAGVKSSQQNSSIQVQNSAFKIAATKRSSHVGSGGSETRQQQTSLTSVNSKNLGGNQSYSTVGGGQQGVGTNSINQKGPVLKRINIRKAPQIKRILEGKITKSQGVSSSRLQHQIAHLANKEFFKSAAVQQHQSNQGGNGGILGQRAGKSNAIEPNNASSNQEQSSQSGVKQASSQSMTHMKREAVFGRQSNNAAFSYHQQPEYTENTNMSANNDYSQLAINLSKVQINSQGGINATQTQSRSAKLRKGTQGEVGNSQEVSGGGSKSVQQQNARQSSKQIKNQRHLLANM